MNKTFHSVWNASKQAWVAAAENVSAKGKPTSGAKVAAVISALFGGLLSFNLHAQNAPPANTLPTGAQVNAGRATISTNGASMVIQQSSNRAAINWQSFNVGSNAQVQFQQPDASSVTLNRVASSDPSQIFGRITANGQVILSNPAGVYFAPNARVDVGGLIATTHDISDTDFMAGKNRFERNASTGSVVNEGELKASLGGYIALLAPEVRNQGAVIAQMGTVAMASGEAVDLKFDSNNRLTSLRLDPSQIAALVDNRHAVQAPGGLIILSAQSMDRLVGGVVKNSGAIEATGLQSEGGRIVLSASTKVSNSGTLDVSSAKVHGGSVSLQGETIELNDGTRIDATGATGGGTVLVGGNWQGSADPLLAVTEQPTQAATTITMISGATIDASAKNQGNGGKVVLWSEVSNPNSQTTAQGSITARAGVSSGNGGQVETSGHSLNTDGIRVDAGANQGTGGLWLLDPADASITQTIANGYATTLGTGTSVLNDVTGDIAWGNNVYLNKTAGGDATLTLKASGNISFGTFTSTTNSGKLINSTSNKLNLVLWSDSDASGQGYVSLNSNTVPVSPNPVTNLGYILTNGGAITIGGGTADVSGLLPSGKAQGGTTNNGIYLNNVFLDTRVGATAGGDVSLAGEGTSTTGVQIFNAKIYANNLSIQGTSAASGTIYGVAFNSSNTADTYLKAYNDLTITAVNSGTNNSLRTGANPRIYADGNFTLNSTGTLSYTSGQTDLAIASGKTLTLNIIGTGTFTTPIQGAGNINKTGTGTLTFSGANSYTGATNVSNGTLQLGNAAALGTSADTTTGTSSVTVNSGAALDLNGFTETRTADLTITGTGTNGALINSSATAASYAGLVTLGGNTTVSAYGGDLTISNTGTITGTYTLTLDAQSGKTGTLTSIIGTGTGGLTKTGAGTWTLSGANTYTGATTISAGTLKLNNAAAIGTSSNNSTATSSVTVNAGGALDLNGFTVTRAADLTITGTGTYGALINSSATAASYAGLVALGGNATVSAYGGNLTLSNAGTITGTYALTMDAQSGKTGTLTSIVGTSTGGVTKSGAGTWTLSGINTYTGATTISAGTLALDATGTIATSSGVANSGSLSISADKTIDSMTGTGTTVLGANTLTMGDASNTSATYGGIISGTGGITKAGTGTLTLSGANTYTGATVVSSGTLKLGSVGALGTSVGTATGTSSVTVSTGGALDLNGFTATRTAGLTVTGTGTNGALINSSATAASYAGLVTLGGDATVSAYGGNLTLSNVGTITGAYVLTLDAQTGKTGTLTSIIGTGAGGVTKSGAGTWTLSGINTYTGTTIISAGTLTLDSTGTIEASSGVANSGSLTITANKIIDSMTGTGTTALGANTLTIGDASNTSSTYGGIISGTGGITKAGTGTLTLSGANTYTGATTISAGTLALDTTGTIATSSGVANSGNFSIAAAKTIDSMTGNGTTDVGSFTLTIGDASNTAATYGGIVSGTGGITKAGTGTLTLSGVNTYTGATTISTGTLALDATGKIEASSGVANSGSLSIAADKTIDSMTGTGTTVLGANTLTIGDASNTSATYGGIISGAGGITKAGTGTLTISGANTYTGATTVNAGTLQLGNVAALGTTTGTSSVTVNTGGALDLNGFTATRTAGLTITGTGTNGALINSSATAASYAGLVTLGGDATVSAYGGNLTLSNVGTITGTYVLTLDAQSGKTGTLTSIIGTGTGGVSKSGAGTWTLSGINTYTGATTISTGTLALDATGTIANSSGVANSGNFSIAAAKTIDSMTGTGTTTLGANTLTIGDASNTSSTYGGIISGTGGITKAGTGTLTLSGNNTYTGTTTVSTGTLQAAHNNALGTTAGNTVVTSGATLAVSDGVNIAEPLQLSGTGASSVGALNLLGTNTYSGAITLAAASTITGGMGTQTLSGNVNGAYGLTITSSGSWVQSGALGNSTALASVSLRSANAASLGAISAQGTIDMATLSGNLTLTNAISTTNTNSSAIVLNAAKDTNALTSTDGDIIVSGGSLSVGSGGRATLYSGSLSGSTGLVSLIGSGSGRFRYASDETTANYTSALGTGSYAVFREKPTANIANMTASMTYGDALPSISATGAVNGDASSYNITSAVYSAASQLNASATPYTITSTLGGLGYNVTGVSSGTLTVSAKALTMSGLSVATSKVYNGTMASTVSGTATLLSAEAVGTGNGTDGKRYTGDTVSITGTAVGTYNSKDVASANTVTFSGLSLTGTDAGNYTLTVQSPASATITAKALTMSGLMVPTSKVYDGTTGAVVSGTAALQSSEAAGTGTTADGKPYTGDTVAFSGTAVGTYNSKDVSTASTVTFSGLSLNNSNYSLTVQSPASATITAKALTMSGLSVPTSKIYNGTTAAAVSGSAALQTAEATGTGTSSDGTPYTGDTVAITGTVVGTYNSKDVSTASTVTFSGLSLNNSNYTLTIQSPASATIIAKALTMSGLSVPASRVYDGTTAATVSGTAALLSAEAVGAGTTTDGKPYTGDTVALTGTVAGNYNSKDVSSASTVTFSGLSLNNSNYTLTVQSPASATITTKALTMSGLTVASSRVYDGTTAATVSGTAALQASEATGTGTTADGKPYTGDTVAFTGTAVGTYNSKDVSSASIVTFSGLSLNNSNYRLTVQTPASATITAKALTISGLSSQDKVYDGTTTATANGTAALQVAIAAGTGTSSDGKVYSGDSVSLTGTAIGNFNSKDVASANQVAFTGLSLTGAGAGNYTLTPHAVNSTARITPAPLTVTVNDDAKFIVEADRVGFNGVSYSGFVNGETSSALGGSATITRSNAGTNVAGTYTGVLGATGLTSTNYAITYRPGSFTITPANQLLVQVSNASSTYGANTQYAISSVKYYNDPTNNGIDDGTVYVLGSGGVAGSSVSISSSNVVTINDGAGGSASFTLAPSSGVFSHANKLAVGNYQLGPSGAVTTNSVNFSNTITVVGAHQVNTKGITTSASNVSKAYDGSTNMNGVALGLSTVETNDVVSVGGKGLFADKNVGTGLNYAISDLALSGADAGNYHLTGGNSLSGSNGAITAIPLTITANNASKTYDSQAYSGGNGVSYSGFVGGESVSVLGGTLSYGGTSQGATIAGSYTIVPSGLTSSNYTIGYANGTLTIAKANATVTANSGTSTYNGANQTVSGFTASGLVGSETVAVLTGVSASRTEKNAGTYPVTASGTDSNYNLTFVDGAMTINPAVLTVTANNASKTYDGVAYSGGNGVSYSGLVGSESASVLGGSLSYGGTSQGATNAGSGYTIVPSGLTSSNYTISYVNGTLAINPAAVLVTTINGALQGTVSKMYDGTNTATLSPANYALMGWVGSDGATVTKTSGAYDSANAGSGKTVTVSLNASDYAALSGTNLANYILPTTISGAMGNISQAALTVTANNANKTYDGVAYNGGNGVNYSGFAGGESASVLGGTLGYGGTSQGATNAGTGYTIVPSGLSSPNYAIGYANGTLTINPVVVTTIVPTPVVQVQEPSNPAITSPVNHVLVAPAKPSSPAMVESAPVPTSPSTAAAPISTNSSGVTVDVHNSGLQVTSLMVAVSVPKGTSTTGTGFSFEMPETVKSMAPSNTALEITQDNGAPVPTWLKFDRGTMRFEATAVPDSALPMQLHVTVAGQRMQVVISERTE